MQKILVIFTTVLLTFSFIKCEEEDTDFDGSNKIGVRDIMRKCNETFRIEISYLHELHKSGEFPDETDKTPKCYIRCVLVGVGVTTEEGQFNARQAGLAFAEVNPRVQAKEVEELATGCVDRPYLQQLNKSGSFPDETNMTPKCYVRCVLETTSVATEDGQFDPRQAALVIAEVNPGVDINEIEEMATGCTDRLEKYKCERSYQFIKCLTEKQIEKFEEV